jgi:hypothetical protein
MNIIKKAMYFIPRLLLFAIFFVYVIFAALTYFDYFERYLFPLHFIQGKVQIISNNILIGPYPHFDELKKLQKETGVEVVISLLNTGLPQEKALHRREIKVAERLGIELKSFPLTYLKMNGKHNREMADKVAEYVKSLGDKTIYIHCYLGRHRVVYIRDQLKKAGIINMVPTEEMEDLG